jgi:DNA-binding transcriptional MerR regulator
MKINEAEDLLNTPRANIRYYEKEGLINISRKENGYRNYSEVDIQRLKKIIILRKLGVSVEQIKDLLSGDAELSQVLEDTIVQLEKQVEELKGAIEVSKEIKNSAVNTEELDENYYWTIISEKEDKGFGFPDTLQDFLSIELDIFNTMWKNVFLLNLKKIYERLGYKKAFIIIFTILVVRGLSRKFLWQGNFWEGFLYPVELFLIASAIILPIILLGKKYPKVAKAIITVIFFGGCVFLISVVLFLMIGIILGIIEEKGIE